LFYPVDGGSPNRATWLLRWFMTSEAELIALARGWIDVAQRVVVLTGAGISTDSGIPDFRGPQGAWTKNPKAEAQSTLEHYLKDTQVRAAVWQERLHSPVWASRPNSGHRALVELEQRGKLHALITQNVDELHRIAGNGSDRIIEVHGSMRRVMCWGCGARTSMQAVLKRVQDGEADPACVACNGILKSDTISFGQMLVPEVIERAMAAVEGAQVLMAVGTTLQVYPIAGAVPHAREVGARVVIVNDQPTPMDEHADAVIRTPIGVALPTICGG
jgi:NAD-dependent deacetylase